MDEREGAGDEGINRILAVAASGVTADDGSVNYGAVGRRTGVSTVGSTGDDVVGQAACRRCRLLRSEL